MSRIATLKQAAEYTGFSSWELRQGARAGKYPHLRVGNSVTGKILFDLDLLSARIQELMKLNIKKEDGPELVGQLRKVKG